MSVQAVKRLSEPVFRPDWTVHPGEILREELQERNMRQTELAALAGLCQSNISLIIHGRAGITAHTAVRLELGLGISAEFWLRLQASYDLFHARAMLVAQAKPEQTRWERKQLAAMEADHA